MKDLIKDQCERNREKADTTIPTHGGKTFYYFEGEHLDQITQQTAEAVLSAVRSYESREALAKFVMDKFNSVPKTGHFWFDEHDADDILIALTQLQTNQDNVTEYSI